MAENTKSNPKKPKIEQHEQCLCGEDCNCTQQQTSEQCNCGEQHTHTHSHTHNCCEQNCDCESTHEKTSDVSEEVLYYLDLSQRIKADFENYKRRNAEISKLSYNAGVTFAVEKLLPIIDGITRAKLKITDKATLDGFNIINTQFLSALSSLGVSKIECVGEQFNPKYHNAVMTVAEKDLSDGVVVEDLQQGFILEGKVIRHSVVKINKL